jgi:hypothetical protein
MKIRFGLAGGRYPITTGNRALPLRFFSRPSYPEELAFQRAKSR